MIQSLSRAFKQWQLVCVHVNVCVNWSKCPHFPTIHNRPLWSLGGATCSPVTVPLWARVHLKCACITCRQHSISDRNVLAYTNSLHEFVCVCAWLQMLHQPSDEKQLDPTTPKQRWCTLDMFFCERTDTNTICVWPLMTESRNESVCVCFSLVCLCRERRSIHSQWSLITFFNYVRVHTLNISFLQQIIDILFVCVCVSCLVSLLALPKWTNLITQSWGFT